MQSKKIIKLSSDGLSEESTRSWQSFWYNIYRVLLLGDVSTEDPLKVISGGLRWTGSGWTMSRASQGLHSLTQVPLATAEYDQYRNAWLYCLSMLWNVEVTELSLSDAAAEAAFRLASVCSESGDSMEEDDEDDHPEGESPMALDWDDPGAPCSAEPAYIWNGVQSGERRLDLKQVLGSIPRFTGLPSKPPWKQLQGRQPPS